MVDVCLVVEGGYPYVTGGVSAWAHGLLAGLPGVSFTVAHVGHGPAREQPVAYEPPANARLVHVDLDADSPTPPRRAYDALPEARVYHAASTGVAAELARVGAARRGAGFALTEHGIAWRETRWGLDASGPGGKAAALWAQSVTGCRVGGLAPPPPTGCRVGGFAPPPPTGCQPGGFAFAPLTGCQPGGCAAPGEQPLTRRELTHRADAVLAMALRAYAEAGAVTSVCGPNARLQRALGAPARRLAVIPNPVGEPPPRAEREGGPLVGFVGRVVAVKDVETFLRACGLVGGRRPDARFVVVGPTHHEPAYARGCVELARELGLDERITFTGETDPRPWLSRLDALVLTSLSEAQPLVALEAMAAGVPVVATDVGGCREAIGDAGLLTRPADPHATAAALLRVTGDEMLAARLGAAGRRRAATAHDPARVHDAYREMYERLAA